ncbi:hypothetical protein [Gryllotalpicola protaetiae]|uniref:hypothetical protein n=1 Tax=Gryllotalpicola protaetiae TaxID=2419771 RepID=UPI00319E53BF
MAQLASRARRERRCTRGPVVQPVRAEQHAGSLVGLVPVEERGSRVAAFPLTPFLGTMGVAVAGSKRPHLNEAVRKAVRAALSLFQARFGMDEHLAYAYLSAATDFNISQVMDIVCGVHARIRESDFAEVGRD